MWTALLAYIFFITIKHQNRLRISFVSEIVGSDINKMDAQEMKEKFKIEEIHYD